MDSPEPADNPESLPLAKRCRLANTVIMNDSGDDNDNDTEVTASGDMENTRPSTEVQSQGSTTKGKQKTTSRKVSVTKGKPKTKPRAAPKAKPTPHWSQHRTCL